MMKKRILLITVPLLMMMSASYAASTLFTVNNNSSMQGIFVEFNGGAGPQISNCTAVTGASGCCAFPSTQKTATFTISSNIGFNISVGNCGSTTGGPNPSSSQAEFTLQASGVCGGGGVQTCDVVDVSNLEGTILPVTITPQDPKQQTINNGTSACCGVFTTTDQSACATPPSGCSANQLCPGGGSQAANYCTNTYPAQSAYTVTFG